MMAEHQTCFYSLHIAPSIANATEDKKMCQHFISGGVHFMSQLVQPIVDLELQQHYHSKILVWDEQLSDTLPNMIVKYRILNEAQKR